MIDFMKYEELHLFLIWEKGRFKENRILNDIEQNFCLLKTVNVFWNAKNFKKNLSRFYGKKLKKSYKKEKSTGTGTFVVALVLDKGAAHHQKDRKNSKMVQFKIKYRQWTGGGHLVHASDCAEEANENLLFLFGFTAAELKKSYARLPDFYDRGLFAERGFTDKKAFLKALDKMPFDVKIGENDEYKSPKPMLLARLLNADKKPWFFGRDKYSVRIGGKKQTIRLIKG